MCISFELVSDFSRHHFVQNWKHELLVMYSTVCILTFSSSGNWYFTTQPTNSGREFLRDSQGEVRIFVLALYIHRCFIHKYQVDPMWGRGRGGVGPLQNWMGRGGATSELGGAGRGHSKIERGGAGRGHYELSGAGRGHIFWVIIWGPMGPRISRPDTHHLWRIFLRKYGLVTVYTEVS